MLLATLALAGWSSAAAQDDPSLNTSWDGYTFRLDWLSRTMPEPCYHNRQGFGRDNKFYIKDKNDEDETQQRIHVYGPNGFIENVPAPAGLGSNFTTDEAGNFIVRPGQYNKDYWDEYEIRIIEPNGTSHDFEMPEDCPATIGHYWGFAQGNVASAEGGKLLISASNIDYIYVLEIKSGQLVDAYNVPMPMLFGPTHNEFAPEDYISAWKDANGRQHYLAVSRLDNPIDITLDGRTATGKEIMIDTYHDGNVTYGSTNGANCFAMNGKNYIMFNISPNWGDGFVIGELGTDDEGNLDGSVKVVARHMLSYNFDNANTLWCNWLNAEPRDDKSVYVYQYYPNFEGGYMARYIFGIDDTPLEYIVNEGTVGDTYTIADDIWGIYIAEKEPKRVYAKDLGRHRSPSRLEAGQVDYVRQWAHLQTVDWDQSNWVLLDFDTEDEAQRFAGRAGNDFDSHAARVIKGGTLTGVLTDKLNPTMHVTAYTEPQDADEYDENRYVTANFMTPNVQTSPVADYADTPFFFVKPKAQEYVWVKWATYEGETSRHFKVPQQGNVAGLQGGFTVDWSLYPGNYVEDFVEGKTYDFRAIVRYNQPAAPSTQRAQADVREGDYTVFPLEGGEKIITAVTQIDTDAPVVDVTYVNLMGMQASQPFEGVNLVIARHSDGTVTTTKVIGHRQ